jgi:hypothetical protein
MKAPKCPVCGQPHWNAICPQNFVNKIVTKSSTKKKKPVRGVGRPPKGERAMTGAERVAAHRARQKQQKE